MANRNFPNGKSIYIPNVKPVLIDCSFIVDSANGNGLGIRSLKGSMVNAVYMKTSATKAPLSPGGTTGPATGVIVVQLTDNFNSLLSVFGGRVAPLSGSNIAVDASDALLTAGNPYIITVLGTTTAADWVALGVPSTQTPAPGLTFIAAATGAGTGTGQVQAPATNGTNIFDICAFGDSKLSNGNFFQSQTSGMQLVFGCYKDSSGDNPVLAAPADGTVISFCFYMNDSSVPT